MKIQGYEILGELGRGGMATVHRARDARGREVALKLLASKDRAACERFAREVRLLGDLDDDDGFVAVLDAGVAPEGAYYVMELAPSGTLHDRLARGALPVAEAIAVVRALAAAIGRAHERGLVHRDLKPTNVLFDAAGRPLVADLGLAKHFRTDVAGASRSISLSEAGDLRGTVGYMAPEQMQDSKTVGPPADVFALGAVLYECLTGVPAYRGRDVLDTIRRVVAGEREAIASCRPEVPRAVVAVVDRALATDPAVRYADGAALASALDAVARETAPRRAPGAVFAVVAAGLVVAALIATGGGSAPAAPGPALATVASGSGSAVATDSRARAREVLRDLAAGRCGENRARALLGAPAPSGLDEAFAAVRAAREMEQTPAQERGAFIVRMELLATYWRESPDPLADREECAASVARVFERLELDPSVPREQMVPFAAAAMKLVAVLGPAGGDELRGLIVASRGWLPADRSAEALQALIGSIDFTRLSPDIHGLVCMSLIGLENHDARAAEADRKLERLLELHRRSLSRGPVRTPRGRSCRIVQAAGLALLAVELAPLRRESRGALLAEARAALAERERLDTEVLERTGKLNPPDGSAPLSVAYMLAREEGDAARLTETGARVVAALKAQERPYPVDVVVGMDAERRAGHLASAAALGSIEENPQGCVGRDARRDLAVMRALVAAERGESSGRLNMRRLLDGAVVGGHVVAPWLRAEAEALLAR